MRRRQGPMRAASRGFLLAAVGVLLAADVASSQTLRHHRRYLQAQEVEIDATDSDRASPPTGGLDDQGSSEQSYRASLVGGYLRDRFMLSNASNAPANNQEPYYPGCGIFDAINREGRGCNFIRVQKAFLVRYWIDFESLTLDPRPVLNTTGELPHMLAADLRPNPPKQVPQDIIKQELPTYYFCYKAILRLYQVTFGYLDGRPMSWPFLQGEAWENQKLHFVHSATRGDTPMAASTIRGDRMLIVLRGTMWLEEWDTDFQYQWADQGSEPLLPGKVHTGMMAVFSMFYKSVLEEVRALQPREILVTGHSLGAGLAIYLGHVLQNRMAADWPLDRVDVVGFGGPNPGDQEFVDSYSATVNARHVLFVGEGAGDPAVERKFVLGDVVAQYTCGPYPACDSIGTGPSGGTYEYARPRSQVPFAAGDMNNSQRWHSLTNLYHGESRIPSFRRIIAAHVCSYLCWTAGAVGDPADHCHFRDDKRTDIPQEFLCDTSSVSLP